MAVLFPRGAILWASGVPARDGGDPKRRPVVLLQDLTDAPGHSVLAVAITTLQLAGLGPISVQIPFQRNGGCASGLREPSVAVCDWILRISSLDIDVKSGYLKSSKLREILEIAARFLSSIPPDAMP